MLWILERTVSSFSYFSTKAYDVDTRKNRLAETVLSEHPKHMFLLMDKKIIAILRFCFWLMAQGDKELTPKEIHVRYIPY